MGDKLRFFLVVLRAQLLVNTIVEIPRYHQGQDHSSGKPEEGQTGITGVEAINTLENHRNRGEEDVNNAIDETHIERKSQNDGTEDQDPERAEAGPGE
jgi:hypothetical protein